MKIFFISARGDSFGGASLHVRDMARRLLDDGHQAKIAVGGSPDMEVPRRFAEKGLDFVCIPEMGRSINPLKDWKSVSRLRKEIRAFAPDLISTHASKAGALGRIANIGTGIPVIYTPHCWSFVDGFPNAWVYRTAEKIFAPLTSKIVAVCQDERDFGLKMGVGHAAQTICIHNGVVEADAAIPPSPTNPTDREKPVNILMVGRFEAQKDQPLLLQVLSDLPHLNWKLTLVGGGPRYHECVTLADHLGISHRVHFAGYSSEVERHLAEADIFSLVTHWEGFPRSILEAMRASLPVVASDVGGSREAVVDGLTGHIVPRGEPAPLKAALESLLTDPQLRKRMGRAARELFLSRFTFEHMYQQYRDLYQSLAA